MSHCLGGGCVRFLAFLRVATSLRNHKVSYMLINRYGLSMLREIGIQRNRDDTFTGRCAVHMDAFCWVKRDSYLPQGSQGLKAVTRYKLGYDPVEVDPEDMVKFAHTQPEYMASYVLHSRTQ